MRLWGWFPRLGQWIGGEWDKQRKEISWDDDDVYSEVDIDLVDSPPHGRKYGQLRFKDDITKLAFIAPSTCTADS